MKSRLYNVDAFALIKAPNYFEILKNFRIFVFIY